MSGFRTFFNKNLNADQGISRASWQSLFGTAVWNGKVWVFPDNGSTKVGIHGSFRVPTDINPVSPVFATVDWSAVVNTGDVVFFFHYNHVTSGNSFKETTWEEELEQDDAAPATTGHIVQTTVSLGLTPVAGALVQYYFGVAGDNVNCDLGSDALIIDAGFEYTKAVA